MFCVYKNGSVERVFRGEFKDDTGTYPAAHLRAIGVDGRAELNVYLFTDQSKSGYDNAFYVMGEISDAAPDENGDVIRTSTPIERNVNAVKAMIKSKITQMRSSVAHDGVVYMDKNFVFDICLPTWGLVRNPQLRRLINNRLSSYGKLTDKAGDLQLLHLIQ